MYFEFNMLSKTAKVAITEGSLMCLRSAGCILWGTTVQFDIL